MSQYCFKTNIILGILKTWKYNFVNIDSFAKYDGDKKSASNNGSYMFYTCLLNE